MINKFIKFPPPRTKANIIKYFKTNNLNLKHNIKSEEYAPDLKDLYILHQLIILNKRLTVLEFGTGWSTAVIQHALNMNKNRFNNSAQKLEKINKFETHVVDASKKYLNISKKRIRQVCGSSNNCKLLFSECKMTIINGNFVSEYEKLPLCNPDFIYLDAPNPFLLKNKINGFTCNHKDMMPMSYDIIKFEHFLCPGTIILVDGRTANARFLRSNFQRNWEYLHDKKNDQHLFYLNEEALGERDNKKIKFYSKK